jgi:hypothetical protein
LLSLKTPQQNSHNKPKRESLGAHHRLQQYSIRETKL